MSGSAVVLTLVILAFLFRKKDFREIMKYCTMGLIIAFIDIAIEYLGTSTGHWTYNESIYFIFNLIPVELFFLFFSAGVIARVIFLGISKIKIPVRTNIIFYILILITILVWVRETYLEYTANILPLATLVGLWGISNISDRNKGSSLILAMLAVAADFASEIAVIGSGSYSYRSGFTLSIP